MPEKPEELKGLPVPLSVVDDSERRERFWSLVKLRRDDQQTVFWLVIGLVICTSIWLQFCESGGANIGQNQSDAGRELKFLVDLNHAPQSEILQLPGVGETLAARIIEYRNEIAAFEDETDLENIRGIGAKKRAAISPYVYVSNNDTSK